MTNRRDYVEVRAGTCIGIGVVILVLGLLSLFSGCVVAYTPEQHAAKHGVVLECRCLPEEYQTKCLVDTEHGPKTYVYQGVCEVEEIRVTRHPIVRAGTYNPYMYPQTGNVK